MEDKQKKTERDTLIFFAQSFRQLSNLSICKVTHYYLIHHSHTNSRVFGASFYYFGFQVFDWLYNLFSSQSVLNRVVLIISFQFIYGDQVMKKVQFYIVTADPPCFLLESVTLSDSGTLLILYFVNLICTRELRVESLYVLLFNFLENY